MIREVLRMGEPRLLQRSQELKEFGTPDLQALLQDMRDTMAHLNGAGLAAPQIGVGLRVVIFGVHANPRCLSVPGMRGSVPRYKRLRYRGFDENGKSFERDATDFHARVVQHEVDHLDGILYPMRIRDLSKFGFNEALVPGQPLPQED